MRSKIKSEHLFAVVLALFAVLAAVPFITGRNVVVEGYSIKTLSCVDSDEGIVYYYKGEITLTYLNNERISTAISEDKCVNDAIEELFCFEGQIKKDKYDCPHGCSDGACIASDCVDSDTTSQKPDGKDYYTKGIATFAGKFPEIKIDYCLNAKTLSEYFCAGETEIRAIEYICPHGCENGICVGSSTEVQACKDTDYGKEYSLKGTVTSSNGKVQTDYCHGTKLGEYYCTEDGTAMVEYYTCPNGCESGVCL